MRWDGMGWDEVWRVWCGFERVLVSGISLLDTGISRFHVVARLSCVFLFRFRFRFAQSGSLHTFSIFRAALLGNERKTGY